MITLDRRLAAVASLVRPGADVADIGCDHGYLAVSLIANGTARHVTASDLREGPLSRAAKTVEKYRMADRIDTVLSDGLAAVSPQTEDIVIAGMGAETMIGILAGCEWVKDPDKRLILQPMTKAHLLRRFLYQNGFSLLTEQPVEDGRRIYSVMLAAYTGAAVEIDELFALTGKVAAADTPAANAYLNRVAGRLDAAAAGREQNDPAQARRLRRLARQIKAMAKEKTKKESADCKKA